MSRRGSPAAKLSRALSTKAVSRVSSEDGLPGAPASGGNGGGSHVLGHSLPAGALISAPVVDAVMVNGEQPKHVPKSLRQFIMEAPTQFTTVRSNDIPGSTSNGSKFFDLAPPRPLP